MAFTASQSLIGQGTLLNPQPNAGSNIWTVGILPLAPIFRTLVLLPVSYPSGPGTPAGTWVNITLAVPRPAPLSGVILLKSYDFMITAATAGGGTNPDAPPIVIPLEPLSASSMGFEVTVSTLPSSSAIPIEIRAWVSTERADRASIPFPWYPGHEIPSAPMFHTNFSVANGGVALAAPSLGANWIFSCTANVASTPEVVQLHGAVSSAVYGLINLPSGSNNISASSPALGPQIVAEALEVYDAITSQLIGGTVHWSPGPPS